MFPSRTILCLLMPILLAPLAGCVVEDVGPGVFVVPALPAGFTAEYVDGEGDLLTLKGRTVPSLDRVGVLRDVLVVTAEGDSGVRWTRAFDACGGPAWEGHRGEDGVELSGSLSTTAFWLWIQGLEVAPGSAVHDRLNVTKVADRRVVVGDGQSEGRVVYDDAPVPIEWTEFVGNSVWKRTSYEGEAPAGCGAPPAPTLSTYGRDGPVSMPAFPEVSLEDTIAYLRGPFGPEAFHAWEDAHADSWLTSFFYTPPLISYKPDAMRPAFWILVFSAGGADSGINAYCEVDALDSVVPSEVRPLRCSVGEASEENASGAPPEADLAYPDPAVLTTRMVDLGLTPTSTAGWARDGSSGFQVGASVKETGLDGIHVAYYWLQWDEGGRLAWAWLPADSTVLGY